MAQGIGASIAAGLVALALASGAAGSVAVPGPAGDVVVGTFVRACDPWWSACDLGVTVLAGPPGVACSFSNGVIVGSAGVLRLSAGTDVVFLPPGIAGQTVPHPAATFTGSFCHVPGSFVAGTGVLRW